MSESDIEDVSRQEKISALLNVAKFNPKFSLLIVALGLLAAAVEGVGLGFILPIIELIQADNPGNNASGILSIFISIYRTLGIPFSLGTVVTGVIGVMTIRYSITFLVGWFREQLRTTYIRDLQLRAFDNALSAHVEYFDSKGSDNILNAIITQTYYAGQVIQVIVRLIEQSLLSLVYLSVAVFVSPVLTFGMLVVFGGVTVILRRVIEPGYVLGEKVADANERRQEAVQAGTQGIRDIRIFGITQEIREDFINAVDRYTNAKILLRKNEIGINNFHNFMVAVSVFALIYGATTFLQLSLSSLGLFLFAIFRLGPRLSNLSEIYYTIENKLPHLVRTQNFIVELAQSEQPKGQEGDVPSDIHHVEFDNVWFSYEKKDVLKDISFDVSKGDFIAFVGQSGAGKSTTVSLLTRMYEQDRGDIKANGISIDEMDIKDWRDRLSVVRQNPYIFDDTLRYNLTIGNRDATKKEIDRICRIAKVDEFIDDLPNGYATMLGDNGVRLSGGQKQRVALARALLEDADLLILDEATSDLDSHLEKEVQASIEDMDRNYIIITIAHRLSTVENADIIYAMENGEIIEEGNHDILMERSGKYSELYSIQAGN